MANLIVRRALHKAAAGEAHRRGWLNFRLGFALMRDRRVPILTKLAALASGVTLTAILIAIEFPLESLLGVLVPFLGAGLDLIVDGLEVVALPLLLSSLIIRWMAPKPIVLDLTSVS